MSVRIPLLAAATCAVLAACTSNVGLGVSAGSQVSPRVAVAVDVNKEPRPPESPWRSLVTGSDLGAWRGYRSAIVPAGWSAKDGVLSKERPVADIMTRDEFADFELELEWKISEGGNSGILYRGTEEYDHIYWSAPEYQLLDDDKAPDGKNPLTRAATDYALYARVAGTLKPVGDWNATRIVVKGNHVEHWLNGAMTVAYDLGSADWTAKVAASKFKDWPNYGKATRGHIALQGDHPGALAFRNIRIRELK